MASSFLPYCINRLGWIQGHPEERSHEVDGGGNVERDFPVITRPGEDQGHHGRRRGGNETAHHVHAPGQGAAQLAADVHDCTPARGHDEIIGEAGDTQRHHGPGGILDVDGEGKANGGPSESGSGQQSTCDSYTPREPIEESRHEATRDRSEAAEEQGQSGQYGRLVQLDSAGLEQVSRQPRDIKRPTEVEAHVLPPEKPHGF